MHISNRQINVINRNPQININLSVCDADAKGADDG